MPVQDALGHAGLGGDRPARQRVRPLLEQDALGGGEHLLARVAERHPGRHRASLLRRTRNRLSSGHTPTYGGRMPTLPPARAPFGGRESHQAREIAESFGSDADRYDRARPRYPDALVDRIVAGAPRSLRNPDVLDVGCGTGIVARQFQAAGCRVLGVDPDARMAELARRHGLEVQVSTFEAWHSAGRAFD